jgi:hypothetical protein
MTALTPWTRLLRRLRIPRRRFRAIAYYPGGLTPAKARWTYPGAWLDAMELQRRAERGELPVPATHPHFFVTISTRAAGT